MAAKFLVEALIEGRLDEDLLINAELGLDSGTNSADRAILARVRVDGFDGPGQPLFPDLDSLYQLLDQAAQA